MAIEHSPQLQDGRVGSRIEAYTKFWQKDPNSEKGVDTENRLSSYADVINGEPAKNCFVLFATVKPHHLLPTGYYDGATQLYEFGWAKSFHFSRFYKGEAFLASLARHEHFLASQMNIRPGMRVLDVGCGVGGPAREIAQFTDAQIIGLNNNDFQIQRATKYTEQAGLDNVTFVKGDFMKLTEQFGENYFDAGEYFLLHFLHVI
jgi:sterol 24-C-methyltransferase